jgi:hypothetical protein
MADDKRSTSTGGSLLRTAKGSLHAEGSLLELLRAPYTLKALY